MGSQKISEKTVSEIITIVRRKVNDNDPPYFANNSDMLSWFNEAHRQAALDSRCIQNTEQIDLIAGQLEYEIVNRYFQLHAVQYIDADGNRKSLLPGSPAEVGHVYDVAEPVKYYEFDGYLGVYPVLSSVTTETVRLYLSQRTWPDKADSDTLNTPSLLDNAIIWHMIASHHWKDEKFSAHAQAMARYESEVYKARTEFYPGFKE